MSSFNEYFLMEEKDVLLYVKNKLKYFSQDDNIICKEIGDGNINYVYRISNGKDSIILKQAGVHTRSNSSGRILDINRNSREADILSFYGSILPDLAPKIISIDRVMNLFVMEDLKSFLVLRDALMKGHIYHHLQEQITDFLVETTLSTADFFTDPFAKKENVIKYTNKELCKISEELVFREPFFNVLKENVFSESLNKFVEDNLYNNKQLQLEAAKLKYEFMNNPQALIHGDLHTGSIFVNEDYIKVMDCEFAFYGPIGYDLGTIIANFIFSYVYHLYVTKDKNYTSFLFNVIDNTLKLFKDKFISKFLNECTDISAQNDYFVEYYLLEVLKTGFGICGLELLRRTTGCARVKEIESVSDDDIRRDIEYTLLNIGIECLSYRERLSEEEKFMKFVDNVIDNINL
ncbi:S-methyl-5-thioribose kinase [Brachyspira hampsonii]|uniref:S-methyl-5-thioribose kinase n=1 Tax=Brachyspira hampsonii TaxID=1287055 RepID=UPI000D34A2EA|nr:S-methyl-5-thioribose kinase [Brachyspira hampsonii]PTY41074.1 methylthioribose kinase [Brachyspira hampsonii bv. II]